MAELEGLEPAGEVWRLATSDGEVAARAVILATGARLRTLGVDGEERLRGRGVSHCASCDAPLMRDRTVGRRGRRRLGAAGGAHAGRGRRRGHRPASRRRAVGAGRLPRARPRAPQDQRPLRHRGRGDPRRRRRQRRARARRRVGRRRRSSSSGGVFVYVGLAPNSEYLRDRLELDDDGRVPTDAALQTELAGVFAAGHRAPRLARAGGDLGRRGRGGGQGGSSLPATTSPGSERQSDTGGRGRARQRRLTWLRSSPSTTRAAIRRRSPASRWRRGCRASRASSALPRRLPVRQLRGLRRPAARVVLRAHARRADQAHRAARELGRRPRDVRGDPGRRGRRRPGGGSLKHL